MPREPLGVKILKAVSSPIRLKILDFLMNRGPLSYTEIMNLLKLKPSRDAGRFAYHLKTLLKMDLIEPDIEKKKYRLTSLGRRLVEVAEEIQESAYERKKMLVRTSRLSLEYFERNKIAESLIREAGVPADLAQSIARETERRLQKLRTKYLTAPLIREFVILIERGLEEYRHKLTRLGLPVYDVNLLIDSMSRSLKDVESVHKAAGDAVLEEYALLNILPRDIADAHISGSIHIDNLGSWVLKPNAAMHDLRCFFEDGLSGGLRILKISRSPPNNLESALSMSLEILKLSSREIVKEQSLDYFNVFLAPFISGMNQVEIEEALRRFLIEVNHLVPERVSIGIELYPPKFISKEPAVGPQGRTAGSYEDYFEESMLLASLIVKVMLSLGERPIFNPSLIIKLRKEALRNEFDQLLIDVHRLVVEKGTPYFANLLPESQREASYTSSGLRFASDWTGDWELDTLRTGSMDSILINLPRAYYDSGGNLNRFFRLLRERLEMVTRALEIKYLTLKQRIREGLLPFLTHEENGDPYYRLENASRLVGFVGLNEAVRSISGKSILDGDEQLKMALDIVNMLRKELESYIKAPEARYALSMIPNREAARRLAELDVEKYGLAKVKVKDRRKPSYTDMTAVPIGENISLKDYLEIEEKFHDLSAGSHLTPIPIESEEKDAEKLLLTTKDIVRNYRVGLFTYSKNMAYCNSCDKLLYGTVLKCPHCGSVKTVIHYIRGSEGYLIKPAATSSL